MREITNIRLHVTEIRKALQHLSEGNPIGDVIGDEIAGLREIEEDLLELESPESSLEQDRRAGKRG